MRNGHFKERVGNEASEMCIRYITRKVEYAVVNTCLELRRKRNRA